MSAKYTSAIKSLIRKQEEGVDANTYFLTVYFPTPNQGLEQVKNNLCPIIKNALRSEKVLQGKEWLNQVLEAEIERKIHLLKNLSQGLAIFIKIQAGRKPRPSKETEALETTIFILHRPPTQELYLGNIFDLDQLIWLDNVSVEAAVVHISRRKAKVYTINQGDIKKITEEKNIFIKEKEREYFNRYGRPTQKGTTFSAERERLQIKEAREDERFLSHIAEGIVKDPHFRTGLDYLMLFYSSRFSDFIEGFKSKLKKKFPNIHLILINKNIRQEQRLKKEVLEKLKAHQQEEEKRRLKNAKEHYRLYAQGWKKVVKAVRNHQIETLFIRPTVQKQGYIRQGLPYLEPVKGSKRVNNLGPWIVKNVFQYRSKVFVLRAKTRGRKAIDIAAQLRFK